jgi:hypothetical protein
MSNTLNPVSLNLRKIAKEIKSKRSNRKRSRQVKTVRWFHKVMILMRKTKQQNQFLQQDSSEHSKEKILQQRRKLKPC